MRAADRLQYTPLDQASTELGERPTAIRQAQFVRGRLGQAPDGRDLSAGPAGGGTDTARLTDRSQALSREGPQVGVGSVDLNAGDAGDVGRGDSSGMEDQGFGAAALPGLGRGFQQAMEPVEFGGPRLADV
jgi:hypothetical protein